MIRLTIADGTPIAINPSFLVAVSQHHQTLATLIYLGNDPDPFQVLESYEEVLDLLDEFWEAGQEDDDVRGKLQFQ